MVKRTEIKDRMLELESFKYCVENGISTKIDANAALNESYTKRVPAEVLARFSKKYEKQKFDMSKVQKDEISVVFREKEGDRLIWSQEAEIVSVHHQYAIVFKTPQYRNGMLESCHSKTVDVVLCRKNTDAFESDACQFIYHNYPDDEDSIERKRKKAKTFQSSSNAASHNNQAMSSMTSQQSFIQVPQQQLPQQIQQTATPNYVLLPCSSMAQMPMLVNGQPQIVLQAAQPMQNIPQNTFSQPQPHSSNQQISLSTINMNDLHNIQPVESDKAGSSRYAVKVEDHMQSFKSEYNSDMYMYGGNGNFSVKYPVKNEPIFTEKAIVSQMSNMSLTDNKQQHLRRQSNTKTGEVHRQNSTSSTNRVGNNASNNFVGNNCSSNNYNQETDKKSVVEYAQSGSAASLLLDNKHDLFSVDDQGDNTLHQAVIHEQHKSLESLLQAMSSHSHKLYEFLNARNSDGQTPLHIAALTNQTPALLSLLNAKADFRKANRHGDTIIHIACQLSGEGHGTRMLMHVANFVQKKNNPLLTQYLAAASNRRNFKGKTALHLAVEKNDLSLLEMLDKIGSDPDKGDRNSGRTPLHYAVQMRNVNVVRYLLYKTRASPNVGAFDNSTPLHIAVETQNHQLIEMMVDKGADPTMVRSLPAETEEGQSCFDMAECDDDVKEILNGEVSTLYSDLKASLDMYNQVDKVLHLGIGGQRRLLDFLNSRMAVEGFNSTDTWNKFMTTLGLDMDVSKDDDRSLFFSVLLHGGTQIGTLKNALLLLQD